MWSKVNNFPASGCIGFTFSLKFSFTRESIVREISGSVRLIWSNKIKSEELT